MYALDFVYNERYLSEYGFIICDFDAKTGIETVDSGSQLEFNLISRNDGKRFSLTSSKYNSYFETTFHICKNPDLYDDMKITDEEYRRLVRWLNQRKFYKFRVIDDENISDHFYFNATFNVNKININQLLYGLELKMVTDAPFAYGTKRVYSFIGTDSTKTYKVVDSSDEIGDIAVDMKIKCNESGDLEIFNMNTNATTRIKNCSTNEVITIDGINQIISTDKTTHNISNDFNYEFLCVRNTLDNKLNKLTFSLDCDVDISYVPIIKNIP